MVLPSVAVMHHPTTVPADRAALPRAGRSGTLTAAFVGTPLEGTLAATAWAARDGAAMFRTHDVAGLVEEMRGRVQRAPKLVRRAAVVIDFGGLAQTPDVATAQALLDGLRDAGVLPVALAYGSSDTERLSEALGLPLLAKFRAQYERADGAPEPAPAAPPRREAPAAEPAPARAAPAG